MTFVLINGDLSGFTQVEVGENDPDPATRPMDVALFEFLQMVVWALKIKDDPHGKIVPGYVLSEDLHSLAARRGEMTFLGVCLGLGLHLMEASRAILASRKLFVHIGDASAEAADYETIRSMWPPSLQPHTLDRAQPLHRRRPPGDDQQRRRARHPTADPWALKLDLPGLRHRRRSRRCLLHPDPDLQAQRD
jgi:hypothetical protein